MLIKGNNLMLLNYLIYYSNIIAIYDRLIIDIGWSRNEK